MSPSGAGSGSGGVVDAQGRQVAVLGHRSRGQTVWPRGRARRDPAASARTYFPFARPGARSRSASLLGTRHPLTTRPCGARSAPYRVGGLWRSSWRALPGGATRPDRRRQWPIVTLEMGCTTPDRRRSRRRARRRGAGTTPAFATGPARSELPSVRAPEHNGAPTAWRFPPARRARKWRDRRGRPTTRYSATLGGGAETVFKLGPRGGAR